jgi:hydroxymethylbilane synthase
VTLLRLATRASALARAQAELAIDALRAAGVDHIETVIVRTSGDSSPERPIELMEGQGWFTAELERALLDGRADLAVHSAKDLPTTLAGGLEQSALLERGDARDAAVTHDGRSLAELAAGAAVGTSSARRAALLVALHPHVRPVPIRGNVDTRLAKLDAGDVDALVLAAAGLDRLGRSKRIAELLDPAVFVPAPAQGAIALEARRDSPSATLAASVAHAPTVNAVAAERAVLEALGGGCLLPLGAWARLAGGRLLVTAALATGAGLRRADLAGAVEAPEELGRQVAALLQ